MSVEHPEWGRFLHFVEHEIREKCKPQRASLRGGPFEWLQTLSGTTFGHKVGPLTIRFFLEDEYQPPASSDHDFVFNGARVELKTGVEYSGKGIFLFEQIRPQQEWDILLCLGYAVSSLTFLTLPRSFVEKAIAQWRNSERSVVTPQHGGSRALNRRTAKPDTYWLWTKPEWNAVLAPHQSTFSAAGWKGSTLRNRLASLVGAEKG
jgi:hypothetical protein